MKNLRVAAVQFEHAAGNKHANLEKIESFAGQAPKGRRIVAGGERSEPPVRIQKKT